jgi:hypothetical protein
MRQLSCRWQRIEALSPAKMLPRNLLGLGAKSANFVAKRTDSLYILLVGYTGGVAKRPKATVCKTVIRRFESGRRLLFLPIITLDPRSLSSFRNGYAGTWHFLPMSAVGHKDSRRRREVVRIERLARGRFWPSHRPHARIHGKYYEGPLVSTFHKVMPVAFGGDLGSQPCSQSTGMKSISGLSCSRRTKLVIFEHYLVDRTVGILYT